MSDALPERQPADVGLVYATSMEIGPFLDRCVLARRRASGRRTIQGAYLNDARLVCVQSGMGEKRASQATTELIRDYMPLWVLSIGFSGALQPELAVGDIVVAQQLQTPGGESLSVDLKMESDPRSGLHVGPIVMADHIVRTAAEKRDLGESTGALAVDMESFAVAAACRAERTKFLAIRVISDDMHSDLPPEVLSILGDSGAVKLGAALSALWNRPSSPSDLLKLRERALKAADRLALFLTGMLPQLRPEK